MYYIYGLRLRGSEKIRYVGITVRRPQKRLSEHRTNAIRGVLYPLYDWMRKHGVDTIEMVILEECDSLEVLRSSESVWIEKLDTFIENRTGGLNATTGGSSPTLSKRTKELIGLNSKKHLTGRRLDEETKNRISTTLKNDLGTASRIESLASINRGKPLSTAHREKISNAQSNPENISRIKSVQVKANHVRWHVNRNIVKIDCCYCTTLGSLV